MPRHIVIGFDRVHLWDNLSGAEYRSTRAQVADLIRLGHEFVFDGRLLTARTGPMLYDEENALVRFWPDGLREPDSYLGEDKDPTR